MTDKTQLAERGDKAMVRQTNGGALRKAAIVPAVDIYEDSHGITLWADLPGVSRGFVRKGMSSRATDATMHF